MDIAAFQLNSLTGDYILHHTSRAAEQWRQRHRSLEKILASPGTLARTDHQMLERIEQYHAKALILFERTQTVLNRIQMDPEGPLTFTPELRSLVGQLRTTTQAIATQSVRFSQRSFAHLDLVTQQLNLLVIGLVIGMVLFTVLIWLWIGRRVIRPIQKLQDGIEIYARKDPAFRFLANRRDEIGEVERTFNALAASLAETTVSRDLLLEEVAERRRAENAVGLAMEKIQRSNTDLEQFAYAISHDLQEPLRMVRSYVGLLERRCEGQIDQDGREFITFIVDGSDRMKRMITDLLEYSRITTRGQEPEPVSMDEVVSEARQNLHLAFQESGAQLSVGPLPPVMGDMSQLVRLLQNLLGNAIKYRAPDRVPLLAIAARYSGEMIEFSVTDNGIGIDPQFHEIIFGVFQRLHDRETYDGTGIGLAVARRIVERHGGKIWLSSGVPGRTEFLFTLKAAAIEDDANP
ncbi:sensor histidine kinase [Magnetospira thiophila]